MSFILTSLRKNNDNAQSDRAEPSPNKHLQPLASEALQQQLVKQVSQPAQASSWWGKVSLLVGCTILLSALSYLCFGGYTLLAKQQHLTNLQQQQFAQKQALEKLQYPQDRLHSPYVETHELASYFVNTKAFQQEMDARRQALFIEKQQTIAAQRLADERLQQQQLTAQIQAVLAATPTVFANAASITPTEVTSTESQPKVSDFSLNKENLQDIDPKLVAAFESALQATDLSEGSQANTQETPQHADIKTLGQMPSWLQQAVPTMHFTQHMYTSEATDSWVRLNGKDYAPGDITQEGLIIDEISPQHVIMRYQGERFKVAALSSW
ncbi:general secretion pathway protein GspB [Thalassotalea maritima]|uniref:general secretion pathway protein GspB n=1 Tax=Thalassotalea maritima TaxID=3242416 RepID=UPI0035291514